MYTKEQLNRYPYFQALLGEFRPEVLLDPLTGVVSRRHILGFAQDLIGQGTPFTFCMVDLDNFKFINDTYGHRIGDCVLQQVADSLAAYVGSRGLVGRFGGDELLIVDLTDRTYDEKKAFLGGMYAEGVVLRRNIHLEGCHPFITGTTGCATYPDDAVCYDELFALIDKTLYRGKTKGRNCHIIYVAEKHRDIQIRQIARHGVYTALSGLVRQFELTPGLHNRLCAVLPLLREELRISELYYVGAQGRLRSVRDDTVDGDASDIDGIMDDELFTTNSLERVQKCCPRFYATLQALQVETLMIVRVGMEMEQYGYLVCAEARSRRIWQEDECAILYFLAKLLAFRAHIDGEELDA